MKKISSIIVVLLVTLCVFGCSSSEQTTEYKLGEVVSTDIIELSMEKASLAYYGNAVKLPDEFAMPSEKTVNNGIFTTSKGHVFVAMTFTIKNLDRGKLSVGEWGNSSGKWALNWKVVYDGKEYTINKFDLNNSDGTSPLQISHSYIESKTNLKRYYHDSQNYIMDAGEEIVVRVLGIAKFEPADLKDGFKIIVSLIDSEGKEHLFTYAIE